MCLSVGTPKTINFPFVPNGKLMVVGVPILKHIRVRRFAQKCIGDAILIKYQYTCQPFHCVCAETQPTLPQHLSAPPPPPTHPHSTSPSPHHNPILIPQIFCLNWSYGLLKLMTCQRSKLCRDPVRQAPITVKTGKLSVPTP